MNGHSFQAFQHVAVGPKAIVVAVMAQAWEDLDGRPKLASHAARYFLSALYRHHLAWLGLPSYWLPEGFDRATLQRMASAEEWPCYLRKTAVTMRGGRGCE